MENLIELLKGVRDDIDFRECASLVDDGILDSFDIVEIVNLIGEEYDIKIPAIEIVPENFNSVDAILNMIQRLQEK
ncbi:acyl carrier protein [Clostridium saccharoperbutylacetonicum]|uniref:Acyl carrier protein n=1 Tax=Clostridium saccharoperbutylacetonicum N1-4(HMT) TaxID=931276 RepID=M1MIG8_9CLOT|nr:acyl carrier protein [Clostridium saccharoperbutylacetonicum]AGF54661.1 acyl carrier protein [Clostridium saccharoperbutylacetonicum N1-4(HMT)]NRT58818.1 acyl carrier protein [Clostridium saccharoperbutylacetonicum]NSB28007.1 acyl carrier protein [Clostridium saccharoperbutylacetonicum]NSB41492.1 acyl carrier protein [Clostridium saccharoperbutylacetonicum]